MENSQAVLARIKQVETICGRDVGNGIQPLVQAAQGGLLGAARSIAAHPSPHVAIITGFFVPRATPPAAETDGPIGCVHLAAGLQRAGIPVRLVTDPLCLNAIEVSAQAAGLSQVPFDVVPVEAAIAADPAIISILNEWQSADPPVSHVVSIERAGPSADGSVRNCLGDDITAQTAPLHYLFNRSEMISIGIGDLGNELGMGTLPKALVAKNIKNGEQIACSIACDYPIVCGVSNWGGIGLLAALALLRPEWKSQLTAGLNLETDKQILTTLVNDGPAVDGDTAVQELTVDTFSWEYHANLLTEILTTAGLLQ